MAKERNRQMWKATEMVRKNSRLYAQWVNDRFDRVIAVIMDGR